MRALAVLCVLTTTSAADPKKCVIEKVPAAPAPKLAAPACHRAPSKLQGPLTKAITKGFQVTDTGGKPRVKFPCDGLGAQIEEIVVETGKGHGGTLGFYRARRNGASYDVRGIAFHGASMIHQPASPPFERVTGTVALDLEQIRAAMAAVVTEVVPPRKPGEAQGMSASFSSHDFHILIRLQDSDGRVLERRYTGYESSDHQNEFLGLMVAEQALAPITSLATTKTAVDADDRALFAERFNAAVPQFNDTFSWWVMERYVELARYLGTPKVIAGLLTRMTVKDPNDRSQVDARRDALEALATITGWDARKGGVSEEHAATAYLASCR
jgi:hypothetical protein